LGLSDPGWSAEQQYPDRATGIVETCLEGGHQSGGGTACFILSDYPGPKPRVHFRLDQGKVVPDEVSRESGLQTETIDQPVNGDLLVAGDGGAIDQLV
jgi:hypothetical protein